MAVRPKKNPITKVITKIAKEVTKKGGKTSNAGSKIKLKNEPSSVTFKPNKYALFPGDAEALNKKLRATRAAADAARSSKSGLKAANKTLKTKSANAARKQSFDRAQKLVDKRNELLKQGKSVKELNDSTKFTRKNSLRFNADGSKITPRQSARDNRAFVNQGKPKKKVK